MVNYIVPPVVGALIGYFTNYIAVKMIFKPYRAYYVFGRRVPFTPGLIPSKREKISEAIAKVVKENLLTEEVIRSRLNEEEVRKSLLILTERMFSKFEDRAEELFLTFFERFSEREIGDYVDFSFIEGELEGLVDLIVRGINGKRVEELLPEKFKGELEKIIDEKIEELVNLLIEEAEKPEFRDVVYSLIRENLEKLRGILPILTDKLVSSFSEKATDYVTSLIERSAESPEFRLKISKLLWTKVQELLRKEINTDSKGWLKVRDFLKRALKGYLDQIRKKRFSDEERKKLSSEISKFVVWFVGRYRKELSEIVSSELLKVIEVELPVIMKALDIEGIVKNKIDSLPIEEVEEIILKIISEELKYITLMGGILGFFIGALQIFFI
ncbi:Uncharacterized membrane protein YheB, UPF0754 family [Balnearium lithotrophicum]|uniref:Uncharacterized membrane protein YheB, UPF0754 family n=1 Tax=Balnearium lithotrophicum TaxID=223788 RepID=A0A521DWQ9_9BACT|nr:DUF445 family protein [Balnearium lithotrophicum]SMO75521.1 Uncharacterized membrane protein YheB, UPF0754 family [Balnearium lithotrophicum]